MKNFTVEIEKSLQVLLDLENQDSTRKCLFEKNKKVFLKVTLFKMPRVHGVRKKYLKLRHSRFGDDPEICLFVPNRKTGFDYKISTDEMIDLTIDYYKDFLAKHKIEGIKTIMPLKQLKSEYGVFELRKKLVDRFDLFLCKTSLLYNQKFLDGLGKIFISKNKEPLGISFPKKSDEYDPNFSENFKRAILSTTFRIKPFSDNYSIPIGTTSLSRVELQENLKMVLDQILDSNVIPGGFKNIKALYIGTPQRQAIPLYISLNMPSDMTTPVLKKARKRVRTVKGEISTLKNKTVKVQPSGTVIVKIKPSQTKKSVKRSDLDNHNDIDDDDGDGDGGGGDDDDDDDNDDNDNDEESVAYNKINSENYDARHFQSYNNSDEENDSEKDEVIEKREMQLMKHMMLQSEEEEEEEDEDDDENDHKLKSPPKKMKLMEKQKRKEFKKKEKNKSSYLKAKEKVGKVVKETSSKKERVNKEAKSKFLKSKTQNEKTNLKKSKSKKLKNTEINVKSKKFSNKSTGNKKKIGSYGNEPALRKIKKIHKS